MSDSEDYDCPLCLDEMDLADRNFKPCPCGYQICRFCWNHIRVELNGLCPACRRPYSEHTVEFTPISTEEIIRLKQKKRAKEREKREADAASRRHLQNMRVVQKNLVYVIGLSPKLANEETLRQPEYFGQFGKINKVVINRRLNHSSTVGSQAISYGIYITYDRKEDAAKAIAAVDGSVSDGRTLKVTFGTTKYCTYYLRNIACQNPGCMYLHEPGQEADSYTKEDLAAGTHSKPRGRDRSSSTSNSRKSPLGKVPAITSPSLFPALVVPETDKLSSSSSGPVPTTTTEVSTPSATAVSPAVSSPAPTSKKAVLVALSSSRDKGKASAANAKSALPPTAAWGKVGTGKQADQAVTSPELAKGRSDSSVELIGSAKARGKAPATGTRDTKPGSKLSTKLSSKYSSKSSTRNNKRADPMTKENTSAEEPQPSPSGALPNDDTSPLESSAKATAVAPCHSPPPVITTAAESEPPVYTGAFNPFGKPAQSTATSPADLALSKDSTSPVLATSAATAPSTTSDHGASGSFDPFAVPLSLPLAGRSKTEGLLTATPVTNGTSPFSPPPADSLLPTISSDTGTLSGPLGLSLDGRRGSQPLVSRHPTLHGSETGKIVSPMLAQFPSSPRRDNALDPFALDSVGALPQASDENKSAMNALFAKLKLSSQTSQLSSPFQLENGGDSQGSKSALAGLSSTGPRATPILSASSAGGSGGGGGLSVPPGLSRNGSFSGAIGLALDEPSPLAAPYLNPSPHPHAAPAKAHNGESLAQMLSHMDGPLATSPSAPATEPPASSNGGMMARLMDQQSRNATAQEQHQQRAGQLSEIFARLTAQQGQTHKGSPTFAHITTENSALSNDNSAPGLSSPRITAATTVAEPSSPVTTFGDPAIMSVRMLSSAGLRSSAETSKSRFLDHLGTSNQPRVATSDGSLLRRGSRLPAANADAPNLTITSLGNANNGASRPLSPLFATTSISTTNAPPVVDQPHGLPSGHNLLDTLFKGSAGGHGPASQPLPPGPFGNAEFGHRGPGLSTGRLSDGPSHPLLNTSGSNHPHHHPILSAGHGIGTGPFMSTNLPGPLMDPGNAAGMNPPLHFHGSGDRFMPPPLPPVGLMSSASPFAGGNGSGSFLNGLGATDRGGNNGPSSQLGGMSMAPGMSPLMMPPVSHGAGNGQGFGSATGPHYMHPLSHPAQHGLYPSPMMGLGMSTTNGGGNGLLPGLPHRPLGNNHDIFASHPAAGQSSSGLGGLNSLPPPYQHGHLFASLPPPHSQQPQQQPQGQQQQQQS